VSHLEVFPDGIEMPVAIYVRDPDVFEEPVTERGHDRRFVMRTAPWRLEPFARFGISFAVDLPDGTRLTVDEPYVPTPAPSKPPRTVARAGIDRGGGSKPASFCGPSPEKEPPASRVRGPISALPRRSYTSTDRTFGRRPRARPPSGATTSIIRRLDRPRRTVRRWY
jgi:hypothetical protein